MPKITMFINETHHTHTEKYRCTQTHAHTDRYRYHFYILPYFGSFGIHAKDTNFIFGIPQTYTCTDTQTCTHIDTHIYRDIDTQIQIQRDKHICIYTHMHTH